MIVIFAMIFVYMRRMIDLVIDRIISQSFRKTKDLTKSESAQNLEKKRQLTPAHNAKLANYAGATVTPPQTITYKQDPSHSLEEYMKPCRLYISVFESPNQFAI